MPNGYTWVNANTSLKKIGTFEYDAVYTPDNTLKYNVMDIKITVDVQKIKTAVSQVPVAKYEVLYFRKQNCLLSDCRMAGTGWMKM